jgi:hypothetical protein
MNMKNIILPAVALAAASSVSAGIVFVDLGDVSIPADETGVFINILDRTISFEFPATFESQPWLNLFSGGLGIANSSMVRPWASASPYTFGSDYFVNVDPGVVVNNSGLFVTGESGSEGHVYTGSGQLPAGQFASGQAGFLAFEYDLSDGAGIAYGWIRLTLNQSGAGIGFDLARTDTNEESIIVGAVPEPAAFAGFAGLACLTLVLGRRRRST